MTILRLKGNFCVCKGHEKRITKVLSKNEGLWIKNLYLENGLIHIDGDIEIEKLTDSDKCESGPQPILTLENGVGHSVPRLEWSDMGGLSRSGLRPHGGLTQLGYGGFGTTSTYSYDGQNYQISNYYNQDNDLIKIIRDENPNACSTM
ncbi:hypothetical protein MANES_07G095502v8 [Manihot esculenta]|uniref:Uncharacterized protein n=1 Tax=Manihot esculenta TaxID=3983 RepID=A0ACB7HH69_MANES|nr:hypothetical protein MANES_07G095502v8 [Manihot esculenta]